MANNKYNEEPVIACKGCKSLYLVEDEYNNTICMRCGTMNDTIEYKHIDDYNKQDIW